MPSPLNVIDSLVAQLSELHAASRKSEETLMKGYNLERAEWALERRRLMDELENEKEERKEERAFWRERVKEAGYESLTRVEEGLWTGHEPVLKRRSAQVPLYKSKGPSIPFIIVDAPTLEQSTHNISLASPVDVPALSHSPSSTTAAETGSDVDEVIETPLGSPFLLDSPPVTPPRMPSSLSPTLQISSAPSTPTKPDTRQSVPHAPLPPLSPFIRSPPPSPSAAQITDQGRARYALRQLKWTNTTVYMASVRQHLGVLDHLSEEHRVDLAVRNLPFFIQTELSMKREIPKNLTALERWLGWRERQADRPLERERNKMLDFPTPPINQTIRQSVSCHALPTVHGQLVRPVIRQTQSDRTLQTLPAPHMSLRIRHSAAPSLYTNPSIPILALEQHIEKTRHRQSTAEQDMLKLGLGNRHLKGISKRLSRGTPLSEAELVKIAGAGSKSNSADMVDALKRFQVAFLEKVYAKEEWQRLRQAED